MNRAFLRAAWSQLLMINYEVPEDWLNPLIPRGTELDRFEGKALVSLVGFHFGETRVRGLKIPGHVNFPEVNLRFYVRARTGGEWRRGVVFVREWVPKPAIVWVANLLFRERYGRVPMNFSLEKKTDESLRVEYSWKKGGKWHRMEAEADAREEPQLAGSIEEFITEHYWGYARWNQDQTAEYQVEHPRWKIHPIRHYGLQCDFRANYGETFSSLNGQKPHSVLLAAGSPVQVYPKTIIR